MRLRSTGKLVFWEDDFSKMFLFSACGSHTRQTLEPFLSNFSFSYDASHDSVCTTMRQFTEAVWTTFPVNLVSGSHLLVSASLEEHKKSWEITAENVLFSAFGGCTPLRL